MDDRQEASPRPGATAGNQAGPRGAAAPGPGQAGTPVRVLVAEDMTILADTLVAMLGLEDDISVVAQVADGDAIAAAAVAHQPDVAVVDIGLPGRDGLAAAADLREQCPGCRVLILTVLGKPGKRGSPGRHPATARTAR